MAKVEEEATEGKSKKPIVLILVVLILLGASVGGTLYFMGFFNAKETADEHASEEEVKHKESPKQPVYLAFDKPFTINFNTKAGVRFLQIKVEVMAYDQVDLDNVATHMPVLRNNMIFIFSAQSFENLLTRKGKEKLLTDILLDIQNVMKERTGVPGVEEVFFTSFVVQ